MIPYVTPFANIIITAVPLLMTALGALASERAGILAVFLDGIINFAAFCCFAITVSARTIGLQLLSASIIGFIGTICICMAIIYGIAKFTQYTNANPFLTALAANTLFNGLISFLSPMWYQTKGVLTSEMFRYPPEFSRIYLSITGWFIAFIVMGIYNETKSGQYIRICGSDPCVLSAKGISVHKWKNISWCIAAAGGAIAGCIMAFRLSAFVPNISAGTGWTALAAVFLGKRTAHGTIVAILIFTAAEYCANNIQSIAWIPPIPSAVLLALPYFIAILFLTLSPQPSHHYH